MALQHYFSVLKNQFVTVAHWNLIPIGTTIGVVRRDHLLLETRNVNLLSCFGLGALGTRLDDSLGAFCWRMVAAVICGDGS